jgi:UPF0755 protein
MLSAFSGAISFVLIAAVLGIGFLGYASSKLAEPGPLNADKVVFIAPRTEVSDTVDQLYAAGVIRDPTVMKVTLVIDRKWSQVKAGEYLFKKEASLNDVIDTLVSGKTVLHSVTIPEGLTSEQIVARLRQYDILSGEITDIPPEGTLLPETYRVPRGQTRATIIRQMRDQQTRLLDQIWEKRSSDVPLRSKIELVTMASIIEKETGRSDERTRVASVFYNRLRRGMKLQSDPTIVYGLVGGKGTLGRPIQRDEILRPTRYNTYVIPALPPGPIANPGRASLEAAANPIKTNDLFFVANGTGGHTFAETLDQHNRNVLRWREIERERAAARAAQPASASEPSAGADRIAPGSETEPVATPPAARGRRSDLPDGMIFGEAPDALSGQTVKLAELGEVLKTMAKPPEPVADEPVPPVRAANGAPLPPVRPTTVIARSAPAESQPAVVAAAPDQGQFRLGKGLTEINLRVAGVSSEPSPLDGPDEQVDGEERPNMQTYPVDPRKRSEMNARAAMFGTGSAPSAPFQTIDLTEQEPQARGSTQVPAPRRISDASEGTALDPLRNRTWDLNAAHNVPAFAPMPAAASQRRGSQPKQ